MWREMLEDRRTGTQQRLGQTTNLAQSLQQMRTQEQQGKTNKLFGLGKAGLATMGAIAAPSPVTISAAVLSFAQWLGG